MVSVGNDLPEGGTVLRTDNPVANQAVVANLRDAGGLPTESGGQTRPGALWRSGTPLEGDRDPDGFVWPPAEVIDLRSKSELADRPHPLVALGARVHALPMLKLRKFNWDLIPDLATAYPLFLETGTGVVVRSLEIAARADGPVLVHCAAGKDRTGVTVAVLLRAAGVTRDAIIADYTRTAENMTSVLARIDVTHAPSDPTHHQQLMGAPPEAIVPILDIVDAAGRGSADPHGAWLLQQGADPADLAAWRRRILG
jgi:hypothetical protein